MKQNSETDRLLQALRDRGGVLSESELATYAGVRGLLVASFMNDLVRTGKVKKIDGKTYSLIGQHVVTRVDVQPFSTPKPDGSMTPIRTSVQSGRALTRKHEKEPVDSAPLGTNPVKSAGEEGGSAPGLNGKSAAEPAALRPAVLETKVCKRCKPARAKPITEFRRKVNGQRADICNACWNASVSEGIRNHGLKKPVEQPRPPVPTAAAVGPRESLQDQAKTYGPVQGCGTASIEQLKPPKPSSVSPHFEVEERPGLKGFIEDGFAVIKQHDKRIQIHPDYIVGVLEWLTEVKEVIS